LPFTPTAFEVTSVEVAILATVLSAKSHIQRRLWH